MSFNFKKLCYNHLFKQLEVGLFFFFKSIIKEMDINYNINSPRKKKENHKS